MSDSEHQQPAWRRARGILKPTEGTPEIHTLHIWIEHKPGEDYSARIPQLPGCTGQGETKDEAIADVVVALGNLLEVYEERGVPVPWVDAEVEA